MRLLMAVVALLTGSLLSSSRAEDLTPAEREFFEKNIGKLIKLEPKPIDEAVVKKVFAGKLYKVNVSLTEFSFQMVVMREGDKLIKMDNPTTNKAMPELKSMLDPKFKLLSDADAKDLEAAIDQIFPVTDLDFGFNKDDLKLKAIRHNKNEWTLIRGKFFDDLKGFVFVTDADGAIKEVKHSLRVPAKK